MKIEILQDNEIPVDCFRLDDNFFVGTFENCSKAARALFIRHPQSIVQQVTSGHKYKLKGIKSYKTNIKYRFTKATKTS